jgi:hypothetical protein
LEVRVNGRQVHRLHVRRPEAIGLLADAKNLLSAYPEVQRPPDKSSS